MLRFHLDGLAQGGDALIIVPPFSTLRVPSLAAHILQACARDSGFRVSVLYANAVLAGIIGESTYEKICFGAMSISALVGERVFAAAAYGLPPLGHNADRLDAFNERAARRNADFRLELDELRRVERQARAWADAMAEAIAGLDFRVVGCSATYQQTSSSVALINRIKRIRPEVVTVIGGAACEGEMALGIASLNSDIDYVFSGECESAWPDFLARVKSGAPPSGRVVAGRPCRDLDALPTPCYDEYHDQLDRFLGAEAGKDRWIAYETSRGCWWGERKHCTFCGISSANLQYRVKSGDRVLAELTTLLGERSSNRVMMMDNTMPHTHFRKLLPSLKNEIPGLHIFWEQKPILTLEQVIALKGAGIEEVQAGLEAVTTPLLDRMNKGGSARHNIAFLRYARSVNLGYVTWNLLSDLPGDGLDDWEQTLSLLPLLRHLFPPTDLRPTFIVRFSPYFDRPADFGVSKIKPIQAYADAFPPSADIARIACHFVAEYDSAARFNPEIMHRIRHEIEEWNNAWDDAAGTPPELWVHSLADDLFVLRDTRGLPGFRQVEFLNRKRASLALVGRRFERTPDVDWALGRGLGVKLDGHYVPLATAPPNLLLEFEQDAKKAA